MSDDAVVVRSRRAAFVGALWLAAAFVLFVSGILLLIDDGRVWLELPLSVPALGLGLATWRSKVVFRPDGIDVTEGWRPRRRLLWAVVDEVAVDTTSWFLRVPVWLELADGSTLLLPACWGMSRPRRRAIIDRITPLATPHGVRVVAVSATATSSAGSHESGSDQAA